MRALSLKPLSRDRIWKLLSCRNHSIAFRRNTPQDTTAITYIQHDEFAPILVSCPKSGYTSRADMKHHPLLPHIPRFIPEDIRRRIVRTAVVGGIWGLLSLLIGANILLLKPSLLTQLQHSVQSVIPQYNKPESTKVLGAEENGTIENTATRQSLNTEYAYWQAIVDARPDYRDGYVRLTLLAYQLGKQSEAKSYLDTIRHLDPNYQGLKALEDLFK